MIQLTSGSFTSVGFSTWLTIVVYSLVTCPAAVIGGYLSKLSIGSGDEDFSSKAPTIRAENASKGFFKSSSFYFAASGVIPFV